MALTGIASLDASLHTRRLYPLRYHPVQAALWNSAARFITVPAGRRSGKTERAKRHVVRRAYESVRETRWPDPRFFLGAPTRDQAKSIYWKDLKAMVHPDLVAAVSESQLSVELVWGAEIRVVGMDKPQRIEGSPWDGGVLDEFANMKPSAWGENVRPALSDRRGWCWLIGVPEGRNHYYDLTEYALNGGDPEWASYAWPSADILDPEEVAAARRQLDPLTFQQEYEASFVNFSGRAYYPFDGRTHCRPLAYDPDRPIGFCFDFNVDPGVAAVVQEQMLPGEYERGAGGVPLLDRPVSGTGVIGEVFIPRNSNTPAVVRKLLQDWGSHRGEVRCYGDATGGARGSAQTEGSDWDLIKRMLHQHFGGRVNFLVPAANPPERSRVNAVNTRLLSGDGVVRLMVDAKKAPNVVKDFDGVKLLEGGSGEIDKRAVKGADSKKAAPTLSHISDAVGYYVVREYPIHVISTASAPLRMR